MIKTNQRPGGKQIQPIKCVVHAISQEQPMRIESETQQTAWCAGKNMNDEVGIGFRSPFDWLRGGGSFLDHRVKQSTTNGIPHCFWHITENCSFDICIVATFFFLFHRPSSNPWVQSAVIVYYPGSIWAVLTFPWWCARRPCTCGRLWSLTRLVS